MLRFSEREKVDSALVPQSVANTTVQGRWFSIANCAQMTFMLYAGAMASGKTTTLEILQAQDMNGTNAEELSYTNFYGAQNALATATANSGVQAGTLTLNTVVETNTVTINGVTFTAVAATPTSTQFVVGGTDTITATNLAAAINAYFTTLQFPASQITASASGTVVTLFSTDGQTTLTFAGGQATIVGATLEAIAMVDIDVSSVNIAGGYGYLAAQVTTTQTTVCAVLVSRSINRYPVAPQPLAAVTVL